MVDDIFTDIKQLFTEVWDRFFLAFSRIYEGIFDEKLRENIVGFDFVIVLVSIGFGLFFLRAEIAALFSYLGNARHKDHRIERIRHYIQDVDDDTDSPTGQR